MHIHRPQPEQASPAAPSADSLPPEGRLSASVSVEAELRGRWGASLFADSPLGIAVLDAAGLTVAVNPALADILKVEGRALIGRTLLEAVALEDRDDVGAQLGKLLLGTVARISLDHVRLTPEGANERAVALYGSRLELGATFEGLLVHVLDVSELRTLQMRFTQAQKLEVLGQLAGGIAHDFSNLITAILASCDHLLRRWSIDAAVVEDLQQIRGTALRARDLVAQLLAFARRQPRRLELVSLARAIDHLQPMLRRLLGAQIELRVVHAAPDRLVRLDSSQLDQIIVNLAVNARDAMPSGGVLTLETRRLVLAEATQRATEIMPAGPYCVIEVRDTGVGIPREAIGDIFEPFFTTKEVGTGLGLATVYGCVRQSGGFVFVESAEGEGATFFVFLPEAEGPAQRFPCGTLLSDEGSRPDENSRPGRSGGDDPRTVLLVDDEDAVRKFAARALSGRGYEVIEAADAETALAALADRSVRIDVLITDMVLPGMDGRGLLDHASRLRPELAMLVISGYAEERGLPTGPQNVRVLPKPFTLAELVEQVDSILAR